MHMFTVANIVILLSRIERSRHVTQLYNLDTQVGSSSLVVSTFGQGLLIAGKSRFLFGEPHRYVDLQVTTYRFIIHHVVLTSRDHEYM
jgi:hypothetical protein